MLDKTIGKEVSGVRIICKNKKHSEFGDFREKKRKKMIYVEQLERTKDDGDVKIMSAQSVGDLIEEINGRSK